VTTAALPWIWGAGSYFVGVDSDGAVAVWAPYQARPGRRVLVVKDLADLRGLASGAVTLPLRLYWSPPGRLFDLDDLFSLRSMYQVVLRESDPRRGTDKVRESGQADCCLAGPVLAQGGAAGLGGTSPGAARGRATAA
jgi:hypothetical protein